MSGIGPVEPVNSPDTDPSYDVIGTDAPRLTDGLTTRLHDRLTALSPRARRAGAAAAAITAATAGALILLPRPSTPSEEDPPPTPFPANVTAFRYTGLAATFSPAKPRPVSGLFRFAVTVNSGPPVTLRVTGAAFEGLDARITPAETFTVTPGTTGRVTVQISVTDCSGLPLDAGMPFLDVTLRNTRAIQHHSFIFGGAFPHDLSELLHQACGPVTARPSPGATGSANSQNVDVGQLWTNHPGTPPSDGSSTGTA